MVSKFYVVRRAIVFLYVYLRPHAVRHILGNNKLKNGTKEFVTFNAGVWRICSTGKAVPTCHHEHLQFGKSWIPSMKRIKKVVSISNVMSCYKNSL